MSNSFRMQMTGQRCVTFVLKGKSFVREFPQYMQAINSKLRQAKDLNKLIVDVSESDPVMTTAGRMFDAARDIRKRFAKRRMAVEFRIARDVYDELQKTCPHQLPRISQLSKSVYGVKIRLARANSLPKPRPAVTLKPEINWRQPSSFSQSDRFVISCVGKVREVVGENIRVSLFTDEGEVLGTLSAKQFPTQAIQPGFIFSYEATQVVPGTTRVNISEIPEKPIDANSIMEMWESLERDIPDKEF